MTIYIGIFNFRGSVFKLVHDHIKRINLFDTFYQEHEKEKINNEIFPIILENGFWSGELQLKTTKGHFHIVVELFKRFFQNHF